MKYLIILTLVATLFACSAKNEKVESGQVEGGVDVGNLTMGAIPQTNATMTFPKSWSVQSSEKSLLLHDSSGSKIDARKAELTDLASPNPSSLQQYLNAKFPDRNYKIIDINGLKGVRAETKSLPNERNSDIYLVSERNDFVHIQSWLKSTNDGLAKGEEIILTVRVKYRGEPVAGSQAKTVTLNAYYVNGRSDKKAAYSFQDDCYSYVDPGCRGVSILFGNGGGASLSVGGAGYDHGRIVDLGNVKSVPFESIKIDGEYLIAPLTKISIADIYTAFSPKEQNAELAFTDLKEGHVYLIRTISWPEEDMIIKMKVESLVSDKFVQLTYQKLIFVRPEFLKKQVDELNKYTLENEKLLSEGEVTLHNRSIWNNYFYASFNFENSTSGNMFITNNSWDILFSNGCSGRPVLKVPHTGGALGEVVDLGSKDLGAIGMKDFPDPNLYSRDCGQEIKKGNTYGIYHHRYDENIGAIYGAVKVLDIATDNSWVRLKFRRIHLGPAEHFQKWVSLQIPDGIQSVKLEKSESSSSQIFYPFIGKTGLQGSHYYEQIHFNLAQYGNPDRLFTDYRPYGKDRGFIVLGKNLDMDKVSVVDIEKRKGSFDNSVDLSEGDIIASYLENYYDKTIMLIRVDKLIVGQSVELSYKYLQRAKAPFSDDKD